MSILTHQFSFYKAPIKNPLPYRDIGLEDLYQVIRGNYYKVRTEQLRNATLEQYKIQKAEVLDYITPGGTFTKRHKDSLICASGLISIDIDHIDNPESVKMKLSSLHGMQLIFTSPSGKGVKCIVKDPGKTDTYKDEFEIIRSSIKKKYGLQADNTSDISRACFLCHDPEVWISNEVQHQYLQKKYPMVKELTERLDLVTV